MRREVFDRRPFLEDAQPRRRSRVRRPHILQAALLGAGILYQLRRFGQGFFAVPNGEMDGAGNEYDHDEILRIKEALGSLREASEQ